ncbi:MAG: MATE family efflux transporter [Christensenellales bacterium]
MLDIVLVLYANMGVVGAALATIFSQAVSALLVILALLHATPALRLHWRKIRLHGDLLPRIIRIGLPAGLQSVMYSLSNLVIQSSINRFGTDMMATWTAYGKLDSFFWMIISAFGVTITTFVGQNFGAHKYDRMRKSIRTCLVMATVATLLVTGLLLTFGETLYRLFTDEEVVIQKGMQVLRLLAPFYCTYIGVEVFAGTVRGAGDSLIPMLMTLFGVCVLRVVWVTLIAPMKPDVSFYAAELSHHLVVYIHPVYHLLFQRRLARALRAQGGLCACGWTCVIICCLKNRRSE